MKKNKSVVVEWIYSYIVILLIPFVAILANYYYNTQVIKKEIIRANELVLHNLQQSVDDYLDNAIRRTNYIMRSSEFYNLISNEGMNSNFYVDVQDTIELIRGYRNFESDISNIIYLKEKDYMVWNELANFSDTCYEAKKYVVGDMPEREQWNKLLSGEYKEEFFVTPYLSYVYSESCLIYADTVTYRGMEPTNVFSFIPVTEIEALTRSLGDGITLLIYSGNEVILALNNKGAVNSTEEMTILLEDKRMLETTTHVEMQRTSSHAGVKYCILIPKQEFWGEARHARNVLCISLIGALLVGGVCTFLLIKRNFQPLSELIIKISGQKKKGNEFLQIENAFSSLDSENKQMRNRILTQREILQRNYLLAMMKGKYIGIQEQNKIELCIKENEVIVLVGFKIPMLDKKQLMHDELLWFTLDNIFSELMESEKRYRIEDGECLFYLFVINNTAIAAWKANCLEKINFVCEFLEDKCGTALSAAISMSEHEIERVRFLYQDIMEAFEYKDIIGGCGPIDTENIKDTTDTLSVRSVGVLMETALLKGDCERTLALSKELFEKAQQQPFFVFRMQILEIFRVIAECFEKFEVTDGQRIFLAGYLTSLLEAVDIESIEKIFREVLSYVNSSIFDENDSKGIVTAVKEYVEAHYMDCGMNIDTIADGIGKKRRHMSRVFREETQLGILDYLNELRISKAEHLICSGKYTLKEISEKVGYASYKTFCRMFIKKHGVTPGKYGKQLDK